MRILLDSSRSTAPGVPESRDLLVSSAPGFDSQKTFCLSASSTFVGVSRRAAGSRLCRYYGHQLATSPLLHFASLQDKTGSNGHSRQCSPPVCNANPMSHSLRRPSPQNRLLFSPLLEYLSLFLVLAWRLSTARRVGHGHNTPACFDRES